MGKRGPRPKPTQLRVLHGDRKDRINTAEPVPAAGLPECPPEVSPQVREIWEYTVEQLAVMRTVTPADRDPLICYCEAVVTHRRASALLARGNVVKPNAAGSDFVKNPLVQLQRDAAATIRGFAQEFGLTPSARSEIRMMDAADGRGPERLLS